MYRLRAPIRVLRHPDLMAGPQLHFAKAALLVRQRQNVERRRDPVGLFRNGERLSVQPDHRCPLAIPEDGDHPHCHAIVKMSLCHIPPPGPEV